MDKKNYQRRTNYSKPVVNEEVAETTEEIVEDTPVVEEPIVEEVKEENVKTEEPKTGVVAGCKKLNVRKTPNVNANNIVGVIAEGTEVSINASKSTGEWYSIKAANGVKGFCMKKFIR